jgi:hypothetical protein
MAIGQRLLPPLLGEFAFLAFEVIHVRIPYDGRIVYRHIGSKLLKVKRVLAG